MADDVKSSGTIITKDNVSKLARFLYNEEDRMRPDIEGRGWADLDIGEIGYYENCVKAVLYEARRLRIII